ncbi:bifunctional phosphoribosylaminoimidazolecarboxamide formyltransferase/IMP cyclohydrolase [bacterium]|nr:bifunctional phosphoribosylaminoimidazolecarboxamide formyltransferase/IMP cyclohydrolase [bacterium]
MVLLNSSRTALVSVFDKTGLETLAQCLSSFHYRFFSTGGTQTHLEALGHEVEAVENLTSFPSILGGRVKTLHPKIFGGILSKRDEPVHRDEIAQYEIPNIDVVIVDLYPFEQTLADGGSFDDLIEKIDIGGVSLLRASAKNHADVLVVPGRKWYALVEQHLRANGGNSTPEFRRQMAVAAFALTSTYDSAIGTWLGTTLPSDTAQAHAPATTVLRYGENPHQTGRFVGRLSDAIEQLHGKELSYNNLLDIDSAWWLMEEFDEPSFAIIKHNNACGLASRPELHLAYEAALAADPVSAFGGVLAANRPIDRATAERIDPLFCEIVMAPGFEPEALALLQSKKNRILLKTHQIDRPNVLVRSVLNGHLEQTPDAHTDCYQDLKVVTENAPTPAQIDDLLFASKVCKHTRSNTIVLAQNNTLLASGTGQTSRVDALEQAIDKARNFGLELQGSVMASDAFFPFPDCVEIAHGAGIGAVIQPGGSVKDALSIDFCNEHGLPMVFTGIRHFKH